MEIERQKNDEVVLLTMHYTEVPPWTVPPCTE